jgi:uncharacterized DUF497 family protein
MPKTIHWDEGKNQLLQLQRNISFEQVLDKLERGNILDRKSHPNVDKYPNQEVFIFDFDGYIYYVPFVETEQEIFLKTIIPSRKLTKAYRENHEH